MIEASGEETTSSTISSSSNSVTFAICSPSDEEEEEDLDEEDSVEDLGSSPKEDSANQGTSTGCPIWIKVYNLIQVMMCLSLN